MGNICDCLNNESDVEGLVPPVTRDSRYGGLRDPVPSTLPAEGKPFLIDISVGPVWVID